MALCATDPKGNAINNAIKAKCNLFNNIFSWLYFFKGYYFQFAKIRKFFFLYK